MYSHYGIGSSSKIKLKHITGLLAKAIRRQEESKAWGMWLTLYPAMTKETFINFDDYKKHLFKPKLEYGKETSQEIVVEMMAVIKQHEGK